MAESQFTAAYSRLVDALVQMRKRAGLTQRELAEKLGREQNFVARAETGQRRIDLIEFVWIARACGADTEEEVMAIVRAVGKRARPRRRG